jgi:hypothetical protein
MPVGGGERLRQDGFDACEQFGRAIEEMFEFLVHER